MNETRQKLYQSEDKHGCIESVLVEKSIHGATSMIARVTFWLRGSDNRVSFTCHNNEADVIAVRLVTPARGA